MVEERLRRRTTVNEGLATIRIKMKCFNDLMEEKYDVAKDGFL